MVERKTLVAKQRPRLDQRIQSLLLAKAANTQETQHPPSGERCLLAEDIHWNTDVNDVYMVARRGSSLTKDARSIRAHSKAQMSIAQLPAKCAVTKFGCGAVDVIGMRREGEWDPAYAPPDSRPLISDGRKAR